MYNAALMQQQHVTGLSLNIAGFGQEKAAWLLHAMQMRPRRCYQITRLDAIDYRVAPVSPQWHFLVKRGNVAMLWSVQL